MRPNLIVVGIMFLRSFYVVLIAVAATFAATSRLSALEITKCPDGVAQKQRAKTLTIDQLKREPLLMTIEDIFTLSGHGTVVTGRIERGKVKVGDSVEIVGIRPTHRTLVTGIEMVRKQLREAAAGDNVGLSLRGIARKDLERGQVVAAPGSIGAHKKFKARVDMKSTEAGGGVRPGFVGYRPQFYFRATEVTGVVKRIVGTNTLKPGDRNREVEVELVIPFALEPNSKFEIREGRRRVGYGAVTCVID